jgi:hypothetical protein
LERLSGKFYRIKHAHLQLANRPPPLVRSVAMFVACIALSCTLDVVIFSELYTHHSNRLFENAFKAFLFAF